jgi:hypothetical protein
VAVQADLRNDHTDRHAHLRDTCCGRPAGGCQPDGRDRDRLARDRSSGA